MLDEKRENINNKATAQIQLNSLVTLTSAVSPWNSLLRKGPPHQDSNLESSDP